MDKSSKPVAGILKFRIAYKLVALLMVFGLIPAMAIYGFFLFEAKEFRIAFRKPVEQLAVSIGDVIDRNLFERYGDVQAFALNAAVKDTANWGAAADDNPLVAAMNGYMTGYGIYRLMLVLDLDGNVVAVNSVKANGDKLDTAALRGRNFAQEPWFVGGRDGRFLQGSNGMTGTAVEQPSRTAVVAELYGDDGYVIPFSAPVKGADGKPIGVWVNFADFGLVEEIVATSYASLANEGKKSAEITVLDSKGRIIVDYDPVGQGWTEYRRDPEIIGKFDLGAKVAAAQKAVGGETGSMDAVHARKKVEQAAGFAHTNGAYDYPGLGWSVLVRIPVDEAYTAVNTVNEVMVIAIAVAAVLIACLGYFVGKTAAAPIQKMTAAMAELAEGRTDTDIPSADRGDELGDMAAAVRVFRDNAIERARLRSENEKEQEARAARQRKVDELISSFRGTVQDVLQVVATNTSQMEMAAESLSSIATETTAQATGVSAASEEASANVQAVASAAEELTSSIGEISRQINQTKATVEKATQAANDTDAKIGSLAGAAQKIGEVISLIQDIAEQTNLLALNATIEAARAGEAGKGFAVVAQEVKSLANQTAKATGDIGEHIARVQSETRDAVGAIDTIGKTIARIDEIATSIASAVEEQVAATSEISRNVQEAANGTHEVTENIGGVSQGAQQTGAACEQMLTAVKNLSNQAGLLSSKVDGFLQEVRSA